MRFNDRLALQWSRLSPRLLPTIGEPGMSMTSVMYWRRP